MPAGLVVGYHGTSYSVQYCCVESVHTSDVEMDTGKKNTLITWVSSLFVFSLHLLVLFFSPVSYSIFLLSALNAQHCVLSKY